MPDKFIYLTGSLIGLAFLVVIFVLRKDMRRFILKAGTIGGLLSVITEYWFFQDYWRIPTTFGVAVPSIDDFICGFAFVGLSVVIYPFIFRLPFGSTGHGLRRSAAIPIVIFGLLSMIIFTSILHVNSIIMASVIPLILVVYVLIRDPSLWKRAVTGAVFLGLFSFALYALLFGVLSPHYIEKYFLLVHNPLDPTFFGIMPLAELSWYVAMGAWGAVFYEFLVRQVAVKRAANGSSTSDTK